MAYEWINFNELAYSVNGGEFISLAPYVSGGLGTLTPTFVSNPNEFRSYNVKSNSPDWSMIASCQSSSLNLLPIFAQYPSGSYIEILNPRAGRSTCFRITINKNTWQLNCEVRVFGAVTAVNQFSYDDSPVDGEICVSFLYDPDTNDGKVAAWYRGSYSDWLGDHRMLRQTGKGGTAASGLVYTLYSGNEPQPTPTGNDPYADGGYSETMEGSTGDFDDTSDTIAEPTAPALSAVDSGLITLYGVDRTNIQAFASYLFGSSFDPANFHKLFESPMEAILCLNYMPYTPSSAAATATEISFGAAGTGANGHIIGNQYETIDCGTLDLKEFYGSCLDYSPYTTITLVLPYASAVDIDPDEFNTKTIGIKYRIDNYTGAGLVLISDGTSVLMQIPCTVANPLPISASNYSSIVSAIANTAIMSAGAILAVATGGVGTGAAIALAGGVAASTAGNVMSAKLHYNHGGAGGMGTGMFGVQKPYLIIKRPRQCLPDGNNSFQGYPTFCTKNLGNVSGFTKVFQIHLDSIPATDAEKKELETILKGGVWF